MIHKQFYSESETDFAVHTNPNIKKFNRNFSDRPLKPNQDLSCGQKGPYVNTKIATENSFVSYEYGSFEMCNVYTSKITVKI